MSVLETCDKSRHAEWVLVKSYGELNKKFSHPYSFVQNVTMQNAVRDYLHAFLIVYRDQLSKYLWESKIFRTELLERIEAWAFYH